MVNSELIGACEPHLIEFNWRTPHYAPIWAKRMRMLAKLRDPERGAQYLQAMLQFYRAGNIDRMIEDWGVTADPRNSGTGRPILMPFILFPRQREFIQWLWAKYKAQEDGIVVKSRDCGASWLFMSFCVCLMRLERGASFGIGSRKEDLVDRSGDPDCLFWKARTFMKYLPREIRGPWDWKRNNAHKRTWCDDTDCSTTGEAGDDIGRGGRKTIYGVDEHAFVERPKLVDAALSGNTNCRIEISTVNGLANTFAERARGGKFDVFVFDYHDDPRKCYIDTHGIKTPYPDFAAKLAAMDPTARAAEYDRDFMASVEGVLIPQEWVQAAIGAAAKLGIKPTGVRRVSWDIADAGKDKNSNIFRHGIQVEDVEEWQGQEARMMDSIRRTFEFVDKYRADELFYDKDGMGAPASSMLAMELQERQSKNSKYHLSITGFRGSGAVIDPERKTPGTDRKNEDYLENQKAQSWMALRWRFWITYNALTVPGYTYDPNDLISLNPGMKLLSKLMGELSQPTRKWSKTGKLMVDKTPDDVASPNLSDGVMMAFAYTRPAMVFSDELLEAL